MYEVTYGSKYGATKDMRRSELAKLMRADIKAAKAAGELPADLTVSVKTREYSGGGSIDMYITGPARLYNPLYLLWHADTRNTNIFVPGHLLPRLTPEGDAALETLKKIHFSYNYDGSEIQVDYFNVRYYGHPQMSWELEREAITEAQKMIAANGLPNWWTDDNGRNVPQLRRDVIAAVLPTESEAVKVEAPSYADKFATFFHG